MSADPQLLWQAPAVLALINHQCWLCVRVPSLPYCLFPFSKNLSTLPSFLFLFCFSCWPVLLKILFFVCTLSKSFTFLLFSLSQIMPLTISYYYDHLYRSDSIFECISFSFLWYLISIVTDTSTVSLYLYHFSAIYLYPGHFLDCFLGKRTRNLFMFCWWWMDRCASTMVFMILSARWALKFVPLY